MGAREDLATAKVQITEARRILTGVIDALKQGALADTYAASDIRVLAAQAERWMRGLD